MATGNDNFEWELSKENVQPLSGGRRIANLTAALTPQADQANKLRAEKEKFELELRTYQGDDPLNIWYKYVIWFEQNFPSGGVASNRTQLLEQAVSKFKDVERYKNDPRYLDMWIKFAKLCDDTNVIYSFMFNNNIGTTLADFYLAWASNLETLGNYKRADAIYKEGIEKFAFPRELLIRRHSDFQARVAKLTMDGQLPMETSSQDPSSENRVTLGALKGHGKSKKVGSVRQTTSKSAALGPVEGGVGTSNLQGPGFTIYQEQENKTPNLPPQTGEWNRVPVQSEYNRENQQKPGKWTDAKIRQKSSSIGAAATPISSGPSFNVHTDEDDGLSTVTPRKPPPSVNQVLSTRKPDKPKDPLQHLVPKNEGEASSIPMYTKHLIYMGTQEFSFEELRAHYVQKKEQEKEIELLKEKRLNMEKEAAAMMDQGHLTQLMEEKMRVGKITPIATETKENVRTSPAALLHQSASPAVLATANTTLENKENVQGAKFSSFAPPCEPREEKVMDCQASVPAPASHPAPASASHPAPAPASHPAPAPAPVKHGLIMPDITTPEDRTSQLLGSAISSTYSGSTSGQTSPDNTSGMDAFKSSSGIPSAARWAGPSPTANTKFALSAIMGFFNEDIGVDNADLGFDKSEPELYTDPLTNAPASGFPTNQPGPSPFVIYDENQTPEPSASKVPFTIFEDKPMSEAKPQIPLPSTTPFTIFDENAEVRRKVPHSSDSIPSSRRNLVSEMETDLGGMGSNACPITDQSIIMDNVPLPEDRDVDMDDDPILASQPYFSMTLMQDKNLEDMTFAPGFSSTQNFGKLARFVSTPFHPSGEAPSMAIPPVSMIVGDEENNYALEKSGVGLQHYTLGDTIAAGGPASTQDAPGGGRLASGEGPSVGQPVPTDPATTPATNQDENDSTFGKHVSNLSTITECSDEDHNTELSRLSVATVKGNNGESHLHSRCQSSQPHHQDTTDTTNHSSVTRQSSETKNLLNNTCHEIDASCYHHDESQDLLSQSVMVNPFSDPFDSELIAEFLEKVEKPLELYPNYHVVPDAMPIIKAKKAVILGNDEYNILGRIGEGAYAQVYAVEKVGASQSKKLVLKVQKPPCPWEFYVACELNRRIQGSSVVSSFMAIDDAYFFEDGSCLVNDFCPHGTLLDMVNVVIESGNKMLEPQLLLLCIELMKILEAMMSVDFIHGDIKPDNFLFRGFPPMTEGPEKFIKGPTQCLKLIDFGRGIDMRMFPAGTTFGVMVETSGFQCIEMKTNRPWTYQTDMFGLVGTMHVIIFNEYMNVRLNKGRWSTSMKFRRWFSPEVVLRIFDEFLNVPSCTALPDVSKLRAELEQVFIQRVTPTSYQTGLVRFNQFRK